MCIVLNIFCSFSWNARASPKSLDSSEVDIENVNETTNISYAEDSSYYIVDDSVVINRVAESDDESSSESETEDEVDSSVNSRYKM